MPNLRLLDVDVLSELIDGYRWEHIICNCLPKLITFRLKMKKRLSTQENLQERADKLINSFQSSFWIDKHKWFFRCVIWDTTIYLYTSSERFYHMECKFIDSFASTYPNDDCQKFYNGLTSISDKVVFDQPILPNIRLSNIEYLRINLPVDDRFLSIISSLKRLRSVTVSSHIDTTSQSQLQGILDRAPHLYSLTITQDESLPLQISIFKYTNTAVRALDLYECKHYFNEEQCITLTRSPFGVQCEVLYVLVVNPESIIYFVKNMENLRSLSVTCQNDLYSKHLAITADDEESDDVNVLNKDKLVQWLTDLLPSCLIRRDPDNISTILIWI